jgi:hypothetical protein
MAPRPFRNMGVSPAAKDLSKVIHNLINAKDLKPVFAERWAQVIKKNHFIVNPAVRSVRLAKIWAGLDQK